MAQRSHPLQLRLKAKERDFRVINLPTRLAGMLQLGVELKLQGKMQTKQVVQISDLSPRNT
jgi:hypothetical protein